VLELFATRVFAAIDAISAALSSTVWLCVAWPWMLRTRAPPTVSWAPVMTATWPWLLEMAPTLSPDPVGAGVGAGVGEVGEE